MMVDTLFLTGVACEGQFTGETREKEAVWQNRRVKERQLWTQVCGAADWPAGRI